MVVHSFQYKHDQNKEGSLLSPRTGRPPKGEQSRTGKLTIRVSNQETQKIKECADRLNLTRTDAIMAGIDLLKAKLDKK